MTSTTTTAPADETVWKRMPFTRSEQLKILLIFVDGLPFRTTQQNYPNRLDVAEASDLCGWSEKHLHLLIHRALELDLIVSDDERFYMTERVREWETGDIDGNFKNSSIPGYWSINDGPTSSHLREDNAVYEAIIELFDVIGRETSPVDLSEITPKLASESVAEQIMEDEELSPDEYSNLLVRMAHDLGYVDVRLKDNEIRQVKINERGEKLLSEGPDLQIVTDPDQDLPIILQPDGRMMLPLESSLSHFRRVHPFVLLTGIDNMIEYSIDGRSLVKAENEGWDTASFRQFLGEQTGSVPETVESLFQESQTEAEEVRIEDVHHLMTFENGATAAEAMRVLSNYQPERIDENRLLLKSSSSADTIKKNLSRAGIRIQMATGPTRDGSPLLEVPEEESADDEQREQEDKEEA